MLSGEELIEILTLRDHFAGCEDFVQAFQIAATYKVLTFIYVYNTPLSVYCQHQQEPSPQLRTAIQSINRRLFVASEYVEEISPLALNLDVFFVDGWRLPNLQTERIMTLTKDFAGHYFTKLCAPWVASHAKMSSPFACGRPKSQISHMSLKSRLSTQVSQPLRSLTSK